MKRILKITAVLFVAAQFVQPDRAAPASDPRMDLVTIARPSTSLTATLHGACYDCHSNETRYPWYAYITPLNWWMQKSHVEHGRHHVNFNEWGSYDAEERAEVVEEGLELLKEGEMPMPSYTWLHAEARLADSTRKDLIAFFATLR